MHRWVIALAWMFIFVCMGMILGPRGYLLIVNARGGCYPWSPKQVPYQDNMTLCPGQSATMRIIIPQTLHDHGI
jgi:hypothetical protein